MPGISTVPVLPTDFHGDTPVVLEEKLIQHDISVKELPEKESLEEGPPDYDWDSDEFKDIPLMVREVVSFEDDPTLLTITFQTLVISSFFVILGSFISQLSYFRTTAASFSVFFVILASHPMGRFLARTLPPTIIPLGRFSFSLNPGPWSHKEHALIGIAANAGSQGQWATFLPTNAYLYYGITMKPAVALFYGWGCSLLGFAFAAMVRQILVYDPEYLFPLSLQQVTLYRSMQGSSEQHLERARRQMKVFGIVFAITFVWEFFPEFIFPFTASLAPLCWFATRNKTANFLGAGHGGIGLLNITLDWSNITSTVITQPFSVQVTAFAAFVLTTWLLIPVAYFGNLWGSPTYPIMSNGLFTKNGTSYPFTKLLSVVNGQQVFNETMYEEIGLAYAGAQFMWEIFMWYASYISAFVWCGLFAGPKIWRVLKARFRREPSPHKDRLSKIIQENYKDITLTEWLLLLLIPIVLLLILVCKGNLYMPVFTYFVALGFGAAATLPMSLVYAVSGYGIKVGLFNELVYGYMVDVPGSSRHPLGQLAYRIISGNVWYDARTVIEDQKVGHYLHLPPRQVMGMQIWASILAMPANYGVMLWVLDAKYDYLVGLKEDPTGQWTAQDFKSYNTAGIQYALVGPKRLFQSSSYTPLPYGFLAGLGLPILIWLAYKKWPRAGFQGWNTTIFFAAAANYYGNISTGPFTAIIVGAVWNFWLFRYKHKFWQMWAYISGAAMDTGFNANLLFIFLALGSSGITMPFWWGNNEKSSERCFAIGF